MLNKCLKCREPRHRSNDCRLKNLNLVKAEAGDAKVNNVVKDMDDEEALELEADDREFLNFILQKIFLALRFEKDSQRNKIFKTRGTINDKVCNMIIDSGSSENIVLKELVDVTRISTEKHLAPYRI